MNNQQYISVPGKKTEIEKLQAFLCRYIDTYKLPGELLHDLKLALEETFINIVNYAYIDSNTDKHTIFIEIRHESNSISIFFTDTGVAFNPLKDAPSVVKSADYSKGSMGLQLIRSLTDEQHYARINQTNVFTLIKYYTQ